MKEREERFDRKKKKNEIAIPSQVSVHPIRRSGAGAVHQKCVTFRVSDSFMLLSVSLTLI